MQTSPTPPGNNTRLNQSLKTSSHGLTPFADIFTYGIGWAGYNNPIPTRYHGTNAATLGLAPSGVTWNQSAGQLGPGDLQMACAQL